MAYSKQNFQNGQILNAANLEAMENGIIAGQGAHNLLDNSDFRNPVNSRGKNTYSDAGNEYTIDRWKTQYNTNMSIENGYINIFGNWQLYQIIQNPKDGIYTFAARIRINSAGQYAPNIYVSDGSGNSNERLLDASPGEWKTYILQDDLSSRTAEEITFSLSPRGGNTTASISVEWAAMYKGAYTASTLPPYVTKGKRVEMLNCGVPLAPHNLLDNSDFRNPVNQRGQSSYSGTGGKVYTIDRWHTWSASISLSLQSGYISITNSTDSIYQNISQIIDKHNLTGKAATIAVWDANDNVYCASGVISTNNEIICTTPTDFWFSAVLEDDNTIYFAIRPRGAKTAKLKAAALYEGSYTADTIPAYQPKGYAAELAECQMYYRKMSYPVIPCGNNPAGTQVYGFLPFRMRIANPTVACDTLYFFKGDTTFSSVSSASAASYGAGTRIVFNLSSSVEGNLAGAVAGNGITISADL